MIKITQKEIISFFDSRKSGDLFLVDLDLTLFDIRPRIIQCCKEWLIQDNLEMSLEIEENLKSSTDWLESPIEFLDAHYSNYSVSKKFRVHWDNRQSANELMDCDIPQLDMNNLLLEIHGRGIKIHALTARDRERFYSITRSTLNTFFPLIDEINMMDSYAADIDKHQRFKGEFVQSALNSITGKIVIIDDDMNNLNRIIEEVRRDQLDRLRLIWFSRFRKRDSKFMDSTLIYEFGEIL